MTQRFSLVLTATLLAVAAGTANAQSSASPGTISHPTSAGVLGGVSAGSGDAGASAGGVLTFEVSDWVAVEARGIYMQRGSGAHGLEVTGTSLLTIARSERTRAYLAVGGGLYRARFDLGDARFLGRMSSEFPGGTRFVPVNGMPGFGMMDSGMTFNGDIWRDPWTGPRFTANQMTTFYANRLGQMTIPADGRWRMRSFTDPALTLGGGIRVDVTDRLYVRPDVRALVVFARSDRMILANMTLGIGYRF